MKDLRLLQIVPSLESGGVEQGTIDVANFIADNGYNSFITSNGGRMLALINKKNIKHINLPVHSKNPLIMFKNIKQIENIIKMNHINLVHVRSRAPAWSLFYASKYGCKTVSTFHNVYSSENFLKKNYNIALGQVDYIVAISEFVKLTIIDTYKINEKKITVINRGIDTNFLNPEINDEDKFAEFILKFNIPSNKKIILFPGRLTQWKGQIKFLNIIESYKDEQIIFYFIGDDKNISYYSKLINEINKRNLARNCKILGHLSKQNLKMIYKCADVIISAPLKPEGFCRTISESLAMKKIILSYNFGGAKDQLSGLDEIYKVTPHDHVEMKNKIDQVLKLSNEHQNNLGFISRRHVVDNFSKDRMLDNYLQFYQNTAL